MGIVISGMTADARVLCKTMRNHCLNYEYLYGSKQPTQRLIEQMAKKSQTKTFAYNKRPYGVGMLVASIDATGTHLFETCPSGNFYEYMAMAIGDKCQSAKTYLERNFETFTGVGPDDLIQHGLKALRASAQETELTEHNVSVGIVGKGEDFRTLSLEQVKGALAALGNGDGDVAMDDDQ